MVDDVTPNDQPLVTEEGRTVVLHPGQPYMGRTTRLRSRHDPSLLVPATADEGLIVNDPEVVPEDVPLPETPDRNTASPPPIAKKPVGRPRKVIHPPAEVETEQIDQSLREDLLPQMKNVRVDLHNIRMLPSYF